MKDLRQKLTNAIDSGKVTLGSKKVMKELLVGSPKLVILSSNSPTATRERVIYYSMLADVPYYMAQEDASELGSICGKPFGVSAVCVLDEGESGILESING
jgi:large subunit ribosomal protein L30e